VVRGAEVGRLIEGAGPFSVGDTYASVRVGLLTPEGAGRGFGLSLRRWAGGLPAEFCVEAVVELTGR